MGVELMGVLTEREQLENAVLRELREERETIRIEGRVPRAVPYRPEVSAALRAELCWDRCRRLVRRCEEGLGRLGR